MNDAHEIEQTAAQWRVRRDRDDWSDADQNILDAWLAESTAHRVAWLRMDYGWQRIDRLGALQAQSLSQTVALPSQPGRRTFLKPLALAATVAALAVSGFAYRQVVGGTQRYVTEIGGHSVVTLSDGSRLELNTDTSVRTRIGRSTRHVWLERGEAYFEVSHDETRPFVVQVDQQQIVVVGTRFSVRRDPDRLEVAVAEGRVRVELPPTQPKADSVVVGRGEVVVSQAGALRVTAPSTTRVDHEQAWRQGLLVFDDLTLVEAATEFNRYSAKKLVISDKAAEMRISGSFKANNVDAFIRLLQSAYGLHAAHYPDRVEISS